MDEDLNDSNGKLRARLEQIVREVGPSIDLQREILSQFGALELQQTRNNFEGRIEYARQVCQHREHTLTALVEYGLQTLKWSFLLNAGAIAIVMAYAGSAAGKTASATIMITRLWPFALGCILVTVAGAAAFFNFSYYELHLPTAEALNNFLSPKSTTWPVARGQLADETIQQFSARVGWKANAWRIVAILAAIGSALCFALGVVMLLL